MSKDEQVPKGPVADLFESTVAESGGLMVSKTKTFDISNSLSPWGFQDSSSKPRNLGSLARGPSKGRVVEVPFLGLVDVFFLIPRHHDVTQNRELSSRTQITEGRSPQGCQLCMVPFGRFDERTPLLLNGQPARDVVDQTGV